jgi:hypothetical protein
VEARDEIEDLQGIQEHLQDWLENLSENFHDTTLTEKLTAVCELEFDDALQAVEEAEEADLPLGFGRD